MAFVFCKKGPPALQYPILLNTFIYYLTNPMRKKIIVISSLALFACVLSSASIDKSSSGAPASHTGAPGENTCAASGCHDDNKLNKGTASLQIEVGAREKEIVPGQTYPIKIKISDKQQYFYIKSQLKK